MTTIIVVGNFKTNFAIGETMKKTKPGTYKKNDPSFETVLDQLTEQYYNISGDEDAEIIINWNKREAKEFGVVSLYATNHTIRNAILRCRPGIDSVDVLEEGATIYFKESSVRPLYKVLKVMG